MSFGSPYLLLTLLVVPLVAAFAILIRRRQARYAVSFTNMDVLAGVVRNEHERSFRRFIPLTLLLLGLALAGAAVARPAVKTTIVDRQAVVVMLVDVSGSMEATDVAPSRMGAATRAMEGFINRLPQQADVGLIEFSTQPQVIAAPTTDHERVLDSLQYLTPNGATALGDGISTAVSVIKSTGVYKQARRQQAAGGAPGAIVLLSDGAQDRGTTSPTQAGRLAKAAGIPIYAIAFGTPTGKVRFAGYGTVHVPPDPQTMMQLARMTGGRAFDARTASEATSVYNGLGSALDRRHKEQTLTNWFALAAAVVVIGAALASRVFGPGLL